LPPLTALGAAASGSRALSFVHTHTGETLSVKYWCDGSYQNSCLSQLNHFLRDFRTNEAIVMDRQLFDILYGLQVLADRDATYEIISAYRSPKTNAMLRKHSSGVAEHSMHIVGRALDVRISGFSTRKLQQLALSTQRGGVGFYAKSDFVHLDTGRIRTWVG
jgi:uncharacterized protein YcbK (DUF882 family)